ncbi:hypothetical protein JOF53_005579 [Crossiella equi]|uniref:CU044_5270 family protein n=1 Tax=Crossiella equi TaxID=130796 RepID=A0ABS5AJF7_9PSEU|nr:hypothetical protein [Crossiella equi]MBP2476707.1 hypothetical protein [Crossiella equi]
MSQDPLSPLEQRMLDGLLQVHDEQPRRRRPPRLTWLAVAAVTVLGIGATALVPTLLEPSTPDTPVQRSPAPGGYGYRKVVSGFRYTHTVTVNGQYVDVVAEVRHTSELWSQLTEPRTIRVKEEPDQVVGCTPADNAALCGDWIRAHAGQIRLRTTPYDRTIENLGRAFEVEDLGLTHQTVNLLPSTTLGGREVSTLPGDPAALDAALGELIRSEQQRNKLGADVSATARRHWALALLTAEGTTPAQRAAAWALVTAGAQSRPMTDRLGRTGVGVVLEASSDWGQRRELVIDPATHTLISDTRWNEPPKDTQRPQLPTPLEDYTLYLSGGPVHSSTETR